MVAKLGPQCAGMFAAAIFVVATSATRAEEAARTVTLRPNFISTFTTDRPFKTIMIGNPKIVDATAQDDSISAVSEHIIAGVALVQQPIQLRSWLSCTAASVTA